MIFYPGLHQPSDAKYFDRFMVSINRLLRRRSGFVVYEWIMDSGAFTRISQGKAHLPPEVYAGHVRRWASCGTLAAAVSQDWMCEASVLGITGLTVAEHQRLTVERYDALLPLVGSTYLMPVLQGFWPDEYLDCLALYGDRLPARSWVGVGSVCKRNARVEEIEHVLVAIKGARPDLRLHGFGIKTTALASSIVRDCLHSADSMAWSKAARSEGRDANDWREAAAFEAKITAQKVTKRAYCPKPF